MKPPYRSRFVLRDPRGEETELARFNRAISNYDRRFWLRGLSPEWEVREETTMPHRHPLSAVHVDCLA